ncbi:MAG TPA: AfsR/SARP family transcriptional regulator [Trebonia sp.]|nr:AfsR/SARP family transcriptional regulator [Trebonia sp.]
MPSGPGVAFHELPTADLEVHHDAQPREVGHPPTEPNLAATAGLREELWRAWLVGTAAALMAAGVTTGVLLSVGMSTGGQTTADMRNMPAPSIVSPAPALAGGLVLARGDSVAAAESLPSVLTNAEQFFAAREPGVAAVYRQPGAQDPKYLSFVGVDTGLADPAGRLDAYLRSVADGHADVSFQSAMAGPGGGAGECVSFLDGGGQQSECGWATDTTVGVLDAPAGDYGIAELASLMRQARPPPRTGMRQTHPPPTSNGIDFAVFCGLLPHLVNRCGGSPVHSGDWQLASGLLTTALDLWRGMPLADIPSESLCGRARPSLERLRLQAIEWRVEADLRLGRHANLVLELEALTAEHPLRERFHAQLMLALYRSGRPAEALAAFESARQTLAEQLGVHPGPDLRRLHERILRSDAGLAFAVERHACVARHGRLSRRPLRCPG